MGEPVLTSLSDVLGRRIQDLRGDHDALKVETDGIGQYLVDRALEEHWFHQSVLRLLWAILGGVFAIGVLLVILVVR